MDRFARIDSATHKRVGLSLSLSDECRGEVDQDRRFCPFQRRRNVFKAIGKDGNVDLCPSSPGLVRSDEGVLLQIRSP